jgi:hypothetical protein
VENLLRENRQEGQQREAEERGGGCQHDQRGEIFVIAHVRNAGFQLVADAVGARRCDVFHAQHRQRLDDDQERQRIEQEAGIHRLRFAVAPALEGGEGQAERERAEHARHVELNGIQCDRVRQIFFVDERRDQRLIRGPAERLRTAGDKRQRQHLPDLDDPEIHQQRQRGGRAI